MHVCQCVCVNVGVCVGGWVVLGESLVVCVYWMAEYRYDSNETEEFVRNRTRKHIYTLRMLVLYFLFFL